MSETIRFAIVGARGYARALIHCIDDLAQRGRGRLVAAMLRNKAAYPEVATNLASKGVRIYEDYRAMLDACQNQVDVVVVPTAIHHHAPIAGAAMQAGYHVFVEKPVAGSVPEVDQMIAVRRSSGVQCAVGFQAIYSRAIQALKRRVCDGRFGRVKRIRTMALWPRTPAYYGRNNWAGRLTVDGRPVCDSPFNNALAHQIMNMLYLASPDPDRAALPADVEAELYRAYDIESFDTGCMRLHTENGVEVVFAATHAAESVHDPLLRLEAERASAVFEFGERATIAYTDGSSEVIEQQDPRTTMFDNVVDAVTGRVSAPRCTLEIGRAHVVCIQELHRVAPIATVAADRVRVEADGQRIIHGIEPAIRRAFETGQLFSELDSPGVPFV
jgi:predicted dehydrogenase